MSLLMREVVDMDHIVVRYSNRSASGLSRRRLIRRGPVSFPCRSAAIPTHRKARVGKGRPPIPIPKKLHISCVARGVFTERRIGLFSPTDMAGR